MTRALGAYLSREMPARSAAVYVHQLQKNATMRGSKPLFLMQVQVDHASWTYVSCSTPSISLVDLLVLEQVLLMRARRAGGDARAASLAESLVDDGLRFTRRA